MEVAVCVDRLNLITLAECKADLGLLAGVQLLALVALLGVENGIVHVKVGSVEHPMLPEHYIEWVSLHTKQGNQRKELHPGEKPEVCFALCEGDAVEAVYAYCNLHSLWKA